MKKLLCAVIFLCAAGVSMGADAWISIQLHKENIWSVQDCEYLKTILPKYSEYLNKRIIASKQGKTFQYAVEIKVGPQDEKAKSATLYKPNGTSISLKWDAGEEEFAFDSWDNPDFSLDEFIADFPPGEYRIDVKFVKSGTKSFYETIPDYNNGQFTDIPDANLSQDGSGQLILNWSAVEGTDDYDLGVSNLNGDEVYHEDFVFPYPHDGSTPLGVHKSEGNYEIELTACVWDGDVEFHTHAMLFSFQNKITKCTVAAGTKQYSDSISFSGILDANEADFVLANGKEVGVTIDSDLMPDPKKFYFPINSTTFKKGKYNCKFTEKGAAIAFSYDTKTHKMAFSAKNIDLTGLACPITVTIDIGDYSAQIILDEAAVNGKKSCPFQLMMGAADTLTVGKYKVKYGKAAGTDSITVSGTFTTAGEPNMNKQLAVKIGDQTFTIGGTAFVEKGDVTSCSKAVCIENLNWLCTARLDFSKCTYSITLSNITIDRDGVVPFGIDVFGFDLGGPGSDAKVNTGS